ncbi:ankyrin repeat and SOCS box protein 6 isoform X1 [Polypterus senegalus]|nr:ankyrin repeat and SOCS box protein 6 isoform X1 [Polypterus senegalus]XP_039620365.1 ankyrin repeat and SOCS box protein 6 isoform X1 [Polypterus senegalus]XP_039620366.1 ankyrin repeat and SOCS box protein 6 isoform X1 [Polypterus senegalus]XP_039620367.1 ankyrin repeat and SOCS box protein 6 isoform X1 [Polypterus senegalus]
MPFLHGFRRIIYEYQPLVDEILQALGIDDGVDSQAGTASEIDGSAYITLREVLERESQSSLFKEGISYALFKVAETQLVNAAELLLQYQADLSFEDPVSYYNPLHNAVLRNQAVMVETLVRQGASINKRDRIHESSPLDLASEETERLPCLRTLLDLGADVNAADRNGKTALLHALASSDGVMVHNIENIRLLLERGADANAMTRDGETALSFVVFLVKEALDGRPEDAPHIHYFCQEVAQLLLTYGADPSRCREDESSLMETCLEHFDLHFSLALQLLQGGASFFCTMHSPPCWSGFVLIFQRLCSAVQELKDNTVAAGEVILKAESILDFVIATSLDVRIPKDFVISVENCGIHAQKILSIYARLKDLEHTPAPLKHLCRLHIRQQLQLLNLKQKVERLPLPDRLKEYLLPTLQFSEAAGTCNGCHRVHPNDTA